MSQLASQRDLVAAAMQLAGGAAHLPNNTIEELRAQICAGEDPLGHAFINLRSSCARRSLGATYTPTAIIRPMLSWARERGTPDGIIDPGAGSGRFLLHAARVFPNARLIGVEIDPLAHDRRHHAVQSWKPAAVHSCRPGETPARDGPSGWQPTRQQTTLRLRDSMVAADARSTCAARAHPDGFVELGELCRVHRGQATGANHVWIIDAGIQGRDGPGLPSSVLFATITRARELIAAGKSLSSSDHLRRVVDLPVDLDQLDCEARRAVEIFLAEARRKGAHRTHVGRHRLAWWSVGLKPAAPVVATYMARRAPVFTLNSAAARHLNIAHGLYPREMERIWVPRPTRSPPPKAKGSSDGGPFILWLGDWFVAGGLGLRSAASLCASPVRADLPG